MKIETRDIQISKVRKISLLELSYLIWIKREWKDLITNNLFKEREVRNNLFSRGFINQEGEFTDLGKELYTSLTGESFTAPPVSEWVDKFRDKWSADALGVAGKMGDKSSLVDKLRTFTKKYPDYSIETMMKAADKYIEQERANNYFTFLQQADYFVFKQEAGSKSVRSRLAQFCEIVESEGDKQELFKKI